MQVFFLLYTKNVSKTVEKIKTLFYICSVYEKQILRALLRVVCYHIFFYLYRRIGKSTNVNCMHI